MCVCAYQPDEGDTHADVGCEVAGGRAALVEDGFSPPVALRLGTERERGAKQTTLRQDNTEPPLLLELGFRV